MNTYKLVYLYQLPRDIRQIVADSFELHGDRSRFYRHTHLTKTNNILGIITTKKKIVKELIAECHCVLSVALEEAVPQNQDPLQCGRRWHIGPQLCMCNRVVDHPGKCFSFSDNGGEAP